VALPLYELALMLAARGFETGAHLELHLVTPEAGPLALFGDQGSRDLAGLLDTARIALHAGVELQVRRGEVQLGAEGETLSVERIVTLPLLRGMPIPGLPAAADGSLVTDPHRRVEGVPDVYPAGDGTAFVCRGRPRRSPARSLRATSRRSTRRSADQPAAYRSTSR
jgi:sulfide:quinone oxidoreductase